MHFVSEQIVCMATQIQIEVAYATVEQQIVIPLRVSEATSLREAITSSGILTYFPEIQIENCVLGIFSRRARLADIVKNGDRIEIYRDLLHDPKKKRRENSHTAV